MSLLVPLNNPSAVTPSAIDYNFLKQVYELKLELDKFGHPQNDGTCDYCDNKSEKCVIDMSLCEYYTCTSCYSKDKINGLTHCSFDIKKD